MQLEVKKKNMKLKLLHYNLIENFTNDDSKLFLKIDVQGCELEVLKGLKNIT